MTEQRSRYVLEQALVVEEQLAKLVAGLAHREVWDREWTAMRRTIRRLLRRWAGSVAREVVTSDRAVVDQQLSSRVHDVLTRISKIDKW